MDIRTKLVIVLITVSLSSMWLLGFFAFQTSAALLQEISERQLDALAESKARDLRNVIDGWRDSTRLVASRTQLRINLDRYNHGGDATLLPAMQRIIADAQESNPGLSAIALYDPAGQRVAASGDLALIAGDAGALPGAVDYRGLVSRGGSQWTTFAAPLRLQGASIGQVLLAFAAEDVKAVSSNYTGLGEYGEVLIGHRDASGAVRLLHPVRHPPPTGTDVDVGLALRAAVDGRQAVLTEHQISYRNVPVWAATRFIEDVDWGIAVQLDRAEELQRVDHLFESMLNLGLSLSAFAILFGTLLGMYMARPLRELAHTVDRIRHGEVELRAEVGSQDEIGHLASALNEFLDRDKRTAKPPL